MNGVGRRLLKWTSNSQWEAVNVSVEHQPTFAFER
jgi:hypothetical protein